MGVIEDIIIQISRSRNSCFYHFTDVENLPSIREHGLLSLQKMREREIVPPKPGGTELSRELDTHYNLDRYVHLCFWDQHPMEYVQKNAGHIGETTFLKIDRTVLACAGALISKEVSIKTGAESLPVLQMLPELDLEVCYDKTDWRDKGVQARIQATRKYELLIPDEVPLNMIKGL